jgi:hypothetical protein
LSTCPPKWNLLLAYYLGKITISPRATISP